MIGYIEGDIKKAMPEGLIVNVNGVGYLVYTFETGAVGDSVQLFIHTNVKEAELSLWGFRDERDLELFKLLISVGGIGTKSAMNIISAKGFDNVVEAIMNGEPESLKVSGVGAKLTQKIVIELKDKVDNLAIFYTKKSEDNKQSKGAKQDKFETEAIEAMLNLGYNRKDIEILLEDIKKEEFDLADTSRVVKELLKRI